MTQNTYNGTDSFTNLEQYRISLEENVIKLQKSLRHWQTWEAEYEGLKEEISGLGDDHNNAQLKRICDEFGGELLNDKEVKILLEDTHGQQRDSSQVIGLLNRRIDYVQQNAKTTISLLKTAEVKSTASAVLSQPEIRNEEELPLIEIQEELDEEGNVISSSTNSPNDTAPHVVEALRKAGVKGLPEPDIKATKNQTDPSIDKPSNKDSLAGDGIHVPKSTITESSRADEAQSLIFRPREKLQVDGKAPIRRRKSVSFAEGTKGADATDSSQRHSNKRDQRAAKALTARMKAYISDEKTLKELERIERRHKIVQGTPSSSQSISNISDHSPQLEVKKGERRSKGDISVSVPQNESPEDAALRWQMMKYNMEDVGAVVAEIDIDEKGSDPSSDEDGKYEDQDDTSTEEDEDRFGRTKHCVINDDYRKEMKALEQRLNAKSVQNIESTGNKPEFEEAEYSKRTSEDESRQEASDLRPQNTSPTKEVRFADEVGDQIATTIASTPDAKNDHNTGKTYSPQPFEPGRTPLSASHSRPPAGKQNSLFKSSRQAARTDKSSNDSSVTSFPPSTLRSPVKSNVIEIPAPTTTSPSPSTSPSTPTLYSPSKTPPSPPPSSLYNPTPESRSSSILNATIIERPYTHSSLEAETDTHPSPPLEPDEFDPSLLQQQVATEYHRLRNRMIQRQGGFLASAEEEANEGRVPLREEEGGERKVSRFKAARLRKI